MMSDNNKTPQTVEQTLQNIADRNNGTLSDPKAQEILDGVMKQRNEPTTLVEGVAELKKVKDTPENQQGYFQS